MSVDDRSDRQGVEGGEAYDVSGGTPVWSGRDSTGDRTRRWLCVPQIRKPEVEHVIQSTKDQTVSDILVTSSRRYTHSKSYGEGPTGPSADEGPVAEKDGSPQTRARRHQLGDGTRDLESEERRKRTRRDPPTSHLNASTAVSPGHLVNLPPPILCSVPSHV